MYVYSAGGLALLLFGGDVLVRGAVSMAEAFKVPPLVIGLTVVAFGTSSPELMVSVLVYRLVLQNLEAFLITPLLLRRTVNLLPTVALTAQLGMGALLGLPGVLLALPLVVVMQVIMQTVVVQQIMDRWN